MMITQSFGTFNMNFKKIVDTFKMKLYNNIQNECESEVNEMKLKCNIEVLAASKGMNLSQLAAKAGVTRQSISVIKARGTCKALTAYKLAAALGVDITELLKT